jgi:hypothetical protein
MRQGQLGQIATPASGHRVQPGTHWCADNSAYTGLPWNQKSQVDQAVFDQPQAAWA